MTQNSTPTADPESRNRSSWPGWLAQLVSRNVPPSDPRVIECRSALAYHRVRLAIVADRTALAPEQADALADLLRTNEAVPA